MSLKDVTLKKEYFSLMDNMARDFYIPLLNEAVIYKRAVGFFSSSILVEISKGITGLIKNGGKIQLIASPYLSEEDIDAIRKGYSSREEVIKDAVVRQMTTPKNKFQEERLNLLANLIADGYLDIRIAVTESASKIGMYHVKMGIIEDAEGNKVAFSGSMNESANALLSNFEQIDVYTSWSLDADRVRAKENSFFATWTNVEPGVKTMLFEEVTDAFVSKYKKTVVDYKHIDTVSVYTQEEENLLSDEFALSDTCRVPQKPAWLDLYKYQQDAIAEWARHGYRGIFDMATGTGKTLTGLGAVTALSFQLDHKLAVVICCPYQHLVDQWVEDIEKFNIEPIIGYSGSPQKDWKRRLEDAVRDQNLKVQSRRFFCFVCTNATYSSEFVQHLLLKIKSNVLLMVDEAHNFGAQYLSCLMHESFKYRLALSATINRHNDEEGTEKLFSYFGEKCIEYPLERAIAEKKLTPYKYYPIIVTLTEEELEAYNQLSYEIAKCIIKGKNGKTKLSPRGERLALKRARIVAGARGKLEALKKAITPYLNDSHILVYCGATKGLEANQDFSDVDDDDIRQIDDVTNMLGNDLAMAVSQFTSKENIDERNILKREFAEGKNLKVLIAIKCLDEGVNIPKIKTAFILASTTNPKEYIQRRGRVLRKAEGKEFAEIYDFITLPYGPNEVSSLTTLQLKRCVTLVKNELNRASEFSRLALNTVETEKTIDLISDAYGLTDFTFTIMEDEDYGG